MKRSDINAANELYVDSALEAAQSMETLTEAIDESTIVTDDLNQLIIKEHKSVENLINARNKLADDIGKGKGGGAPRRKKLTPEEKAENDRIKAETDAIKEAEKARVKAERDAIKAKDKAENDAIKSAEKARVKSEKDAEKVKKKAESDAIRAKIKAESDAEKTRIKSDSDAEKAKKKAESEKSKLDKEDIARKKKQARTDESRQKIEEKNAKLIAALDGEFNKRKGVDKEILEIRDKYRRAAEKEIPKNIGLFARMNSGLDKYIKTTESSMGRMSASLFKSGAGFLGDKLDELTDIPGLKQIKTAGKFVNSNILGAKRRRMVNDNAQKMIRDDLDKNGGGTSGSFVGGKSPTSGTDGTNKRIDKMTKSNDRQNKEIIDQLKKLNETVGSIYQHLILKSIINMFGKGSNILGSAGKLAGGAAAAAGVKKAIDAIGGRKDADFDDIDKDKKNKPDTPDKKNKPDTPDNKTNNAKSGKVKAKVEKGIASKFKKMVGKVGASSVLKFASRLGAGLVSGPLGWAVTGGLIAKDLYDIADEAGIVDKAIDEFGEFAETSGLSDLFGNGDVNSTSETINHNNTAPEPVASKLSSRKYGQSIPMRGIDESNTKVEAATLAQTQGKDDLQAKAYMAMAQSVSNNTNSGSNVVTSNTNVNNNNNYGSSYNFNNSHYQSTFDKGTKVER
jgi:hypothetical protein